MRFREDEEEAIALLEDGSAIVTVTTSGNRGGAKLCGGQVKWSAVVSDLPFSVPADLLAQGYAFGRNDLSATPEPFELSPQSLVTELGPSGASRLLLWWSGSDQLQRPMRVVLKAVVQDLFQTTATAETSLIVLPSADPLVGIKPSRSWILPGQSVRVDCVTITHSGELAVSTAVSLSLSLRGTTGEFFPEQSISLTTGASDGRNSVELQPKSFGHYRIEARCGSSSLSAVHLFVPPPSPAAVSGGSMVSVCLHPCKSAYDVGQSVEILVACTVPGAFGLALVMSSLSGAILFEQSFRFDATGVATLKATVERRWLPSAQLCVLGTGRGADARPWWTETVLPVPVSDASLRLRIDCDVVWSADKKGASSLTCTVRSGSGAGTLVEGAEVVVLSKKSRRLEDFSVAAVLPFEERKVVSSDSRQALLTVLANTAKETSSASSDEGSKSFVDLPEEDARDALLHEFSGSVIEDATTTTSSENEQAARLFRVVFVCVEYGGKPFTWAGDPKFEALGLKVVRGIAEPGKRTIRDEDGQFQFVVHRTASNCVAACVTNKLDPASGAGFLVLEDVLTRIAMGSSLDLNDVMVVWNSKKTAATLSPARPASSVLSSKASPPSLWPQIFRYGGVRVQAKEPAHRERIVHKQIFCLGSGVTGADGVARVELPSDGWQEEPVGLHVMAVSIKESLIGTAQAVARLPQRPPKVVVSAPLFVRVGDEFEVVVRLRTFEEKAAAPLSIVIDTSLRKQLLLARGHSNRFVVATQPGIHEYVVVTRFVAASGGRRARDVCCGTITATVTEQKREVSHSASISVSWPELDDRRRLCPQVCASGLLEAGAEKLTVSLAFLGDIANGSEGGLHLRLSRSPLLLLAPAAEQLLDAGTDMVETLSSRVLGLCACFGRLDQMGVEAAEAAIRRDVALLLELQGALGGFGQWSRNTAAASGFLSAHAAHALWEAR